MLPFLKKKDQSASGIIIKSRQPDTQDDSSADEPEYSLEDCAKDIIHAVHTSDHEMLASALQEAFEKMEQEPHEENSKPSPHTYDAQNQAAGEK